MSQDNKIELMQFSAERKAGIESWLKSAEEKCISQIVSQGEISTSMEKAISTNLRLPIILTLCPAIRNLPTATTNGQTRELVVLPSDGQRLKRFFLEVFGFQLTLKRSLQINTEIFLLFADSMEAESERMLINPFDMAKIAQDSIINIRNVITEIDQENSGLFPATKIKIPKIRLQSAIETQGGKIGLNRKHMIKRFETEIMNPNSKLFETWVKHLRLAKDDEKFTETGWQGLKSAESIWLRVRFLIAELCADGIFLPEMAKQLSTGQDSNRLEPIFFASSIRPATIQMEADCLNFASKRGVIPAFRNIGRWLEKPVDSPWIEEFNTGIINSDGQN